MASFYRHLEEWFEMCIVAQRKCIWLGRTGQRNNSEGKTIVEIELVLEKILYHHHKWVVLHWGMFSWDNDLVIPNTHAFFAGGTVESEQTTMLRKIDRLKQYGSM